MDAWGSYLILLGAGFVAGALNVVAGGGSFLTLPVLIFMGLPATVANGTNRVGVVMQNVGAVWGFHRYRLVGWTWAPWVALPAMLGSALGTWAALVVDDRTFRSILAILMVVITLWTLLNPLDRRKVAVDGPPRTSIVPLAVAFFVVGVYGGFVQAGVGFLILAVTSWAGLDLVRGNAIKVLIVLVLTVLSLAIFAWQGKVDWPIGLTLGVGMTLGGLAGVRLTALRGHEWLRWVVTVTVILFAIGLFLTD